MSQYLLSIMKGQRKGFRAKLITYLLMPLSLFYFLGVICHRSFCRLQGVYKAPKPVISIGNITVGGSGKTPLVIWLAQKLKDKGFKLIILIRGYKPRFAAASDEVDMLNEQIPSIPVLAGANRAANIQLAEGILPVDLYICDDAFQHWPLGRDLNIVAIDASNPFGNRHLLPAGILREPLLALKRADVLIMTKTDASNSTQTLTLELQKINPKALILESQYKSAGIIDVFETSEGFENSIKDKRVIGFCAIGDPLSFQLSLKNSGAEIVKSLNFMDHHDYKKDDIKSILALCRSQGAQVLVTTHKDAVKLRAFKDMFMGFRLVYISIQLEITKGSDEFVQKVISICHH